VVSRSIKARDGIAFLLSQLGHRAATSFAELLTPLGLTPAQAGILRLIDRQPGLSQQELAARLELLPSRVVSFIDELEARGYVGRQRNAADRRLYALQLTDGGRVIMTELAKVARQHDRLMSGGLNADQKATLRELLGIAAEHQGLLSGVHPGYGGMETHDASTKHPRRPTRAPDLGGKD
jgi:DNA-binding MarR family transcriptional regulator